MRFEKAYGIISHENKSPWTGKHQNRQPSLRGLRQNGKERQLKVRCYRKIRHGTTNCTDEITATNWEKWGWGCVKNEPREAQKAAKRHGGGVTIGHCAVSKNLMPPCWMTSPWIWQPEHKRKIEQNVLLVALYSCNARNQRECIYFMWERSIFKVAISYHYCQSPISVANAMQLVTPQWSLDRTVLPAKILFWCMVYYR